MSTSHHYQSDWLYEVVNCMVENYVKFFGNLNQLNWDELLPSAEFAKKCAISKDFGTSPFEMK